MPELKDLLDSKIAAVSLLAVYLLSESDYISGFFRLSHEFILKVYMKYVKDISPPDDPFVLLDDSYNFKGLSATAFIRLITFAYLEKHIKLFSHLYSDPVQWKHVLLISNGTYSTALKTLLTWLQYDVAKECKIISQTEWTDFTRRVCFFDSTGSQDLFKTLMPSDSALKLHCLRGEYIITLAMESCMALFLKHMQSAMGDGKL